MPQVQLTSTDQKRSHSGEDYNIEQPAGSEERAKNLDGQVKENRREAHNGHVQPRALEGERTPQPAEHGARRDQGSPNASEKRDSD